MSRTWCPSNKLRMIRSPPYLEKFQATGLYNEIRAASGLESNHPENRWSLVRALQQRENGLAAPGSASFSKNQERYIRNLYIPNNRMLVIPMNFEVGITKFNRDGSKLLTACHDGIVRFYDSSKGLYNEINCIKCGIPTSRYYNLDADFSPDGQRFVITTVNIYICMRVNASYFNSQSFVLAGVGPRYRTMICVRFSPTGDKILGGNHSSVTVTDVCTRSTQVLRTHRMPGTNVNSVCFLSDKNPHVIIAGCDDGLLKVYDLRTSFRSRELSKSVASFIGHYDGVTYIDSRNDGYHVLSNSKDQSIKIWDMRKPSNLGNRSRARQQQMDLSMWDYRWNRVPREYHKPMRGDTSIMTYRGHRVTETLLRAKFSPLEQTGQRYIYTGSATGHVIIYDVLTGKIKDTTLEHQHIVTDMDWHPERTEIVSGSWDCRVHINNFQAKNVKQPENLVNSSDPDNRRLPN